MSYLVNGHHESIPIPGTDRTVTFKSIASYGEELHVSMTAEVHGAPADVVLSEAEQRLYRKRRIEAYVLARTAVMIVSWDLLDAAGQPLPVTPESLVGLTSPVGGFLAGEARRRFEARPEVEERPFERDSPPPSEAAARETPK
jgi:hypothetical protein